jgi:ABC-type sugar transport system ATPase subunit
MTALALKNLSKIYPNGAVALENLSLDVAEGELVVVLGPSGSGKSTLLRLIAGLEPPSGGDVIIGDTFANALSPRNRDIAMVFQDYALYPHFNVAQNLGFGLKMRKLAKREIKARVEETARTLGIIELLDRKPKELSGGQRQRVALGRALVRNPKVFLFDEPLSNLDPSLRVQLRQEIKSLHDSLGVTMIYVTHDQHEAMLMGRRIAILRAGVLEQVGTPAELYCKPASKFVGGFFGTPSMNFIECEASISDGRMEIGCGKRKLLQLPWNGPGRIPSLVSLGFRPEDVRTGGGGENSSITGNAVIASIEALGGETIIDLKDAEMQFRMRVLGFSSFALGGPITYSISYDKLHFFSRETGKRIII